MLTDNERLALLDVARRYRPLREKAGAEGILMLVLAGLVLIVAVLSLALVLVLAAGVRV
jgi:hypothetical protein